LLGTLGAMAGGMSFTIGDLHMGIGRATILGRSVDSRENYRKPGFYCIIQTSNLVASYNVPLHTISCNSSTINYHNYKNDTIYIYTYIVENYIHTCTQN